MRNALHAGEMTGRVPDYFCPDDTDTDHPDTDERRVSMKCHEKPLEASLTGDSLVGWVIAPPPTAMLGECPHCPLEASVASYPQREQGVCLSVPSP